MHLLVLAEDFYPITSGGAHEQWRFCQLAVQNGWDVTVVTAREGDAPRRERVDGVEIRRPFKTNPDSLPRYAALSVVTRVLSSVLLCGYVLWWLRGRDVDVIYSASHLLHWIATVSSIAYRLPHVSYVAYTPTLEDDSGLSFERLLERVNFAYCMGDVAFCRNPEVRDRLRRTTDARVSLVHGIVNEDEIRNAAESEAKTAAIRDTYGLAEEDTMLVYVGRLSALKRPIHLVDVVADLPENHHLVLVGDGPERDSLREAIDTKGLDHRITIAGKQSHEETLQTMAAADVLVLPSRTESYPTVVFEALALGCAVVATPVGILPHVAHSRLHLRDVSAFSDALSHVPPGESSLDEGVLQEFSMETYADEVLSAAVSLCCTSDTDNNREYAEREREQGR